jgi:hypothetical protein
MSNFFFVQVALYTSDDEFLSHSFHWKLVRLPDIGQRVVFRSNNTPSRIGQVMDIVTIFDLDRVEAFDHIVRIKLSPNQA